jgi:hypothetical protein
VKDLKLDVRLACVLAVVASACSSSYTAAPRTATISVATDVGNIKNDGTKANVTVTAADAAGKAGTGTVTLTAAYGDVNASGTPTATLTLDASGVAKTTYACNVATEPRCLTASVTLTATWSAVSNAALLTVLAPAAGTDGGGPPPPPPPGDGGVTGVPIVSFVGVFPAYVIVSTSANTAQNLPGTATATFSVAQGITPVAGTTVTFAEKQGEALVTLGAAWGTTDTSGNVTVTLTGKAAIGLAHITASLATGTPAAMQLPVLGGPTSIIVTAAVPSLLGLKGSGIQETGLMTFVISDSFGSPIPGVTVNFTQAQPALVTFSHSSGVTDDAGRVVADYSAGPEVGVSTITATVVASGASASRAVAVRGARPSASGFNFHCDKGNLPVYTTTSFFQTAVCTVRLSDRYGNRVGISTPVSFAAEAGSISASATTKAFDFGNPADPDEGSVSVTFSSDLGNGFSPADVAPLAAAPTQFPIPRFNVEPSSTNGQLTFNPRDQLVTLIAMVRGEEAFVDTNHDGQFNAGELFVDQGDPYIDANDNNQYDGATEPRFCGGASCAAYNGPNGQWDSDRTIWVPTWVVFSGTPSAIVDPWVPASACVDYTDNNASNSTTATTSARMIDHWMNTGALGTTYGATLNAALLPPSLTTSGGFPEQDGWGSMGVLHFNFDWVRVSAADNTKACAIANGSVCVERLVFGDFDPGYRITATVTDTNKVPPPLAAGAGHACPVTPTAGTHVANFSVTFKGTTGASISNVNSPVGTYGY